MGYSRGTHAHHFGGGSILNQAVFWTKAKGSNGILTDGKGHSIQSGSTSGADTNDPQWLPYTGTQYLYLPGVAGNYASTPDSAAISVSGDLEFQVWCALDNWTLASTQTLVAKDTSGAVRSFRFLVSSTTGLLNLNLSANGSTYSTATSSVAPTVVNGAQLGLRVTWRSSDGRVQFFTTTNTSGTLSPAWTQLGTDQTILAGQTVFDTASSLEIGTINDGSTFFSVGAFYRVKYYSGFSDAGGTLVFDADFTDPAVLAQPFTTFLEKSSNAATVTINRSSSGRKSTVVERDKFLLGTDDYFEIADAVDLNFGAADALSLVVVLRGHGTSGTGVGIAKKTTFDTSAGYILYWQAASKAVTYWTGDGTNQRFSSAANLPNGTLAMIAAVHAADDTKKAYLETTPGSTESTSHGSQVNSSVLRIGATASGTFSDMEFMGTAIFRRALTTTELAAVKIALLA